MINGLDRNSTGTVASAIRETYALPTNESNIVVTNVNNKLHVTAKEGGVPPLVGSSDYGYTTISLTQLATKWGQVRLPIKTYNDYADFAAEMLAYNAIQLEPGDIELTFPYTPTASTKLKWTAGVNSTRFSGSLDVVFFTPPMAIIEYRVDNTRQLSAGSMFYVACTYNTLQPSASDFTVTVADTRYDPADLSIGSAGATNYWMVGVKLKETILPGDIRIRCESPLPLGTGANLPTSGSNDNLRNVVGQVILYIDELTQNGISSTTLGFIDPSSGTKECVISPNVFANNKLPIDASYAFANAKIKQIPKTIFDGHNIVGAVGCFQGTNITTLPSGLFAKATLSGSFRNFLKESKVVAIESGVFPATTEIDVMHGFATGCIKLESVPEDLFKHAGGTLTTLQGAFEQTQLKTVPAKLLDGLSVLTNLYNTFSNSALEEIPEGFFDGCPKVDVCEGTFTNTKIKTIPPALFSKTPDVFTLMNCFSYSDLTAVPAGLLDNLRKLSNASNMFRGCSSLVSVPVDLFRSAPYVTNMSGILGDCTKVYPFPVGLLDYADNVTNLDYSFSYCGQFSYRAKGETIPFPSNMLAKCRKVTTANRAFISCPFDSVAEGAFDALVSVTTMSNFFGGASWSTSGAPLTSIPESLFAKCDRLLNIEGIFAYSHLVTIPPKLFQLMPKRKSIQTMSGVFYACGKLETVPADLFEGFTNLRTVNWLFGGRPGYERTPLKDLPVNFWVSSGAPINSAVGLYSTCAFSKIRADMMVGLEAVTNVDDIFHDCREATSVESGLLVNHVKVTSAKRLFARCASLTTIEGPLQDPTKSLIQNVTEIFSRCTKLPKVVSPDEFISTKIGVFDNAFEYCSGLTEVPSGMIAKNASAYSFKSMFTRCPNIARIKTGAFDNLSTARMDHSNLFAASLTAGAVLEPDSIVVSVGDKFNNAFSQDTVDGGGYRGTVEMLTAAMKVAQTNPNPTMDAMCCLLTSASVSNTGISGNAKPFLDKMWLGAYQKTIIFGSTGAVTYE